MSWSVLRGVTAKGVGGALALIVVLGVGAWLRFTALSWGLRHPVHLDERVYVENVAEMVAAGDLDHRYYSYPGGFFYLLAPAVWLAGATPLNPSAYLVCRGVVAAFGVLNVALAYVVGARLLGRWAGLAAAAFLAVSPVDVRTCHQVRPDILLETTGLLGLLVWGRVGESRRGDVLSGLLIGATTAIKFSGLLMAPSYLAARLLATGQRLRGMLMAGALCVGVVVLCTPYAVVHAKQYRPTFELTVYYKSGSQVVRPGFQAHLVYYAKDAAKALGPVSSLLAVMGTILALRRSWRSWLAPLLHPVATFAVMSSASLAFDRLILPAMGVLYVMAGSPVEAVARRSRLAAGAFLGLASIFPLQESARYVETLSKPSAQDKALDWIEAHVPAGARVLETRPEAHWGRRAGAAVGVDPKRYEFLTYTTDEDRRALCLLAYDVDLLITAPGPSFPFRESLQTVYQAFSPAGRLELELSVPRDRKGAEECPGPGRLHRWRRRATRSRAG